MGQPYIGEIILVGFDWAPAGWAQCNGQTLPISENDALFTLIGTTYGGDGQETFNLPDLRGRHPIHMGQGPGLPTYTLGEFGGVENVTITVNQTPLHAHPIDPSSITLTKRCLNGIGNQTSPVGAVPAAVFADDPISAGLSLIRATHITELRARVDALRARYGLSPYPWVTATLTVGATLVQAQHIIDLRTALSEACTAGSLPQPTYAESVTPGTPIRASHITELRSAVAATPAGALVAYSTAAPNVVMSPASIVMGGGITAAMVGGTQPHNNLQPYLPMNYCISLFGVFPTQA